MIYPKFSQRYLAYILACLLLTLIGVGMFFLVYFFNDYRSPLVVTSVEPKRDRMDTALAQHLMCMNQKKATSTNGNNSNDKQITTAYKTEMNGMNEIEFSGNSNRVAVSKQPEPSMPNEQLIDDEDDERDDISLSGRDNDEAEQQNIYIDDLDNSSIMVRDDMTNKGGKYVATEVNKNKLSKKSVSYDSPNSVVKSSLSKSQTAVSSSKTDPRSKGSRNYVPRFWNMDKLYDNTAREIDDDESEDLDNGDLASGSGDSDNAPVDWENDYSGYDIDTKKFLRRIKLKMMHSYVGNYRKHPASKLKKHKNTPIRKTNENKKEESDLNKLDLGDAVVRRHRNVTNVSGPTSKSISVAVPVVRRKMPEVFAIRRPSYFSMRRTSTTTARNLRDSSKEVMAKEPLPVPSKSKSQWDVNIHDQLSLTPAWFETRTRRIIGNVKKSEERSRQLLLCEKEEAGGGELCRMLFKGHLND